MEKSNIIEIVMESVHAVLDDSAVVLTEDTMPEDVDGWDSVTHVNLISALEEKFGIKFSLREMMSWETIGDLARMIMEKTQDA